MQIFYDSDKKANYDKIDRDTTVDDLLKSLDIFLEANPLPCDRCQESCCKKEWSVEVDNVCVNRLCGCNEEEARKFVDARLVRKKNYYRDIYQYVMKKEKECPYISEDNLCGIYEKRPIICRLYICCDKSYRYNMLRELIGSTYLRALILEHRIRSNSFTERTIRKYKRNPVLFSSDYGMTLNSIIRYAEEEGWIDEDERELLYEECKQL